MRAGQHTGDGAGGVGVAAPVHHVDQAVFQRVGVKKRLKHRLQGVHDIAAGVVAAAGAKAKHRVLLDQRLHMLLQHGFFVGAGQQGVQHAGQRQAGGVGQGAVVGDPRLRQHGLAHGVGVQAKGGQRGRQQAHGGAVAGVVFGGRRAGFASAAKAHQVAAHGVADVHRLAAHPLVKRLRGQQGVHPAAG